MRTLPFSACWVSQRAIVLPVQKQSQAAGHIFWYFEASWLGLIALL
jgi:hypothetical protein